MLALYRYCGANVNHLECSGTQREANMTITFPSADGMYTVNTTVARPAEVDSE